MDQTLLAGPLTWSKSRDECYPNRRHDIFNKEDKETLVYLRGTTSLL